MQNVLLVEDDKKISLALSLRLKSCGYGVDSAPDAVYAMNAAVKCKPDFVLLDINLPGGSGFIVADRLRASAELADTPIIFITASNDPNLRAQAGKYDSSRFIEKPFQTMQLTDAMYQLGVGG